MPRLSDFEMLNYQNKDRHVLTIVIVCFPCFSVGQDMSWVGILCCVSSLSISMFGLIWLSIRGRCWSLSLIGNHIQVACFVLGLCGWLFPVFVFSAPDRAGLGFATFIVLYCVHVEFLLLKKHGHLPRCALVLRSFSPLLLRRRGGGKPLHSIYKLPVIYWVFTNVTASLCLSSEFQDLTRMYNR